MGSNRGRQRTATATLVLGLALAGTSVLAQNQATPAPSTPLTSSTTAIYAGSCADLSAPPVFTLGALEPLPAGSEIADNDAFVDEDIAGDQFYSEDANDNGVLDEGEDVNGNGIIDEAEDLNGDGTLEANEIAAMGTAPMPGIFKSEGEAATTLDDLLDAPHVIAVGTDNDADAAPLACGEVSIAAEDGQIVVALRPVDQSGYYGISVLEEDTGGVPVFGEDTVGVTTYVFQGLSTQRSERAAEATPTS